MNANRKYYSLIFGLIMLGLWVPLLLVSFKYTAYGFDQVMLYSLPMIFILWGLFAWCLWVELDQIVIEKIQRWKH